MLSHTDGLTAEPAGQWWERTAGRSWDALAAGMNEWEPLTDADPALLELTGPWYWGAAPHVLRLLADRWLELRRLGPGRAGSRFRPEPDGTWTGLDGYYAGETLRVVRHPDGSASHLNLATFVFTRTPYDRHAPVPGGVDPHGWRPEPA